MKISLVISDLNIRGGTHKQLTRLAEFLNANKCRVTIHTFEFDPNSCYPEIREFDVRETKRARGRSRLTDIWNSIAPAYHLVRGIPKDTDVINVHDLDCYAAILFSKLLRPRAKIVWQINDLPPAYHVGPNANEPRRFLDPLIRSAARFTAQLCDSITVNVGKNQRLIHELMGVRPLLCYCGVDQIQSTFTPRSLSKPLCLLSIGVFYPYRNYETILNAMEVLGSQGVPTKLTLIGATDRSPDYASKIASIAAEKRLNVQVMGQVDELTLTETAKSSHLFLFLNLEQSWGLAVFEAMNMSLPVIVSSSVGAVELVGNCRGARIVNASSPEDVARAVAEIQADPENYVEAAKGAYEFSRSLGWDKMYCPDILALFNRLTGQEPSPAEKC